MLPGHSHAPPSPVPSNSKKWRLGNGWVFGSRNRGWLQGWHWIWLLLAVALVAAVTSGWLMLSSSTRSRIPNNAVLPRALLNTSRDHLLIYAFSYSDSEFLRNLKYFVREAVANDTVADYLIIVQEGPSLQAADLPELPSHAAYVLHQNECYDWGSYGWVLLHTGLVDIAKYRYFFFINSSVRGPFMPAFARGWYHWMSAFTSRLTDEVKLVGSTISCEGSPLHGKRNGRWRRNPHVQSYAVATDQVGLQVLLKDRHVFACHKDRWGTIYYSELGSSLAILNAGFNIDCLMLRYQGVDWRNKSSWNCNSRMTPAFEYSCDGLSLDPLEVMFVKVKSYMLDNEVSFSKKAVKYQAWQQQSSDWAQQYESITSNEYVDDLHKHKTPHILVARARGASCFDFGFYAKENPDLKPLWGDITGLWRHWVYYGQFDFRPHRWVCDIDYRNISAWPGKA